MKIATVIIALLLVLAGCASVPRDRGLPTADRAMLADKTISLIEEPAPETEYVRSNVNNPMMIGGGLAVTLISAAIILALNAAEAAMTDVDGLPAPKESIATHIEADLLQHLSEHTGATTGEVVLHDLDRRFHADEEGLTALLSTARFGKVEGVVLNVRTEYQAFVSSGRNLGLSEERFRLRSRHTATIVDLESGRQLAHVSCNHSLPIGTLEQIAKREAAAKRRYATALERREETLALLDAARSAAIEGNDAGTLSEVEADIDETRQDGLPAPTTMDSAVRKIARDCAQRFLLKLLTPPPRR